MSVGSSVRHQSRDSSGIRYRSGDELLQVDPGNAVKTVRGVGGDPRTLTEELPALPLPGHGDRLEGCGDDMPHFCSNCGETHTVGQTCHRKQCPRCAPAWALKRATAAGAKLEATRRYLYAKRGTSPRFHHLVFSPPEGFAVARDDPLDAGYEIVKNLLDELGTDGAVVIYHPWRGEEDDDRGFWSNILFNGNDWSETVEKLEYAPHFHVIALANYVPGDQFTTKLHEETGWTFKRITKGGDESESNVSLYDDYDLCRALTYSLSHAGVSGTHDAYRYSGRVHNMTASDEIEAEISAAARSVAPDTLGLSYSSTSCERDLEEDEEATAATAPGPGNAKPEYADDDEDEAECGGRLLHIRRADEFLSDGEWCARVGGAGELAKTYHRWLRDEPPPGTNAKP